VFSILVVCTGNVCRSAAAELLLRAGLPAGLVVRSAGTAAVVGAPVHPLTAAALARLGIDCAGHAGRQLVPEQVAGADLVLGMTREHRAAAVRLHPPTVSRAYTFAELARLASGAADPAALLEQTRAIRGVVRAAAPADDDVADPIGRPAAVHDAVVATIAEQAGRIARAFGGTAH